LEDDWVRKNLSVVGLRLKMDLEGKPTIELDDFKSKKSIATTRSFEKDYTELKDIQERVSTFAVTCAEKLRKQGSCCNSIMVFVHTNFYKKDEPQYSKSIVVQADYPTNSSIDLVKLALKGLKAIYLEGYSYKKAGVVVMELTPKDQKQLNMFVAENPKHEHLMNVMDKINKVSGNKVLETCLSRPKENMENEAGKTFSKIHHQLKRDSCGKSLILEIMEHYLFR
jgi:DNA polymerase V